ncbi:MAG: glutathione synthase [Acutalibacteraceae bacterium]
MGFSFDNPSVIKNIYKGSFGIEKESLRVDENGFLSHTNHPFDNNPNIERDFCENQVEIVTDVCCDTAAVFNSLSDLHNKVVKNLANLDSGKELLWLFSNPPYVKGENDIPIASFKGRLKGKEIYRKYLAEKYGKKKMLYSGIHFNISFADELIDIGFRESDYTSVSEYKSSLYLELAKKITRYSWLIVYLTAASPVMDGSFFDNASMGKDVISPFSSARCSEIGYWNDFIPVLKYDTLNDYVESIQKYIDNGSLKSASELYYPIRLKPMGENSLEALKTNGVNHIELRMLDLNPLSPVGIFKEDIDFLHILILYLSSLGDEAFPESEQLCAVRNVKKAAKYDDENTFIDFYGEKLPTKKAAQLVLSDMQEFFERYNQKKALQIIEYQMDKITDTSKRYAGIIREKYGKDYVKRGVQLSSGYAEGLPKEDD